MEIKPIEKTIRGKKVHLYTVKLKNRPNRQSVAFNYGHPITLDAIQITKVRESNNKFTIALIFSKEPEPGKIVKPTLEQVKKIGGKK